MDNDATQTNSHILPHSLIKTAINKDGSKYRDYELTFGLSGNEFVDTHFGRSITLETIEQYKGRELTEEEKRKENPFAKDFLFCPSCEKNISQLESYYVQEVLHKLKKNNFGKQFSDTKGNIIATYLDVNQELVLLLAYSIFFRCSVAKFHGYKLGKWEEKLRKVLFHFLDNSIPNILNKIKGSPDRFLYLPIVNTFFIKDVEEDPTKNFVTILHSHIPLFIYLNDVTFHLYLKDKHVGKSVEHFFGMKNMINVQESINQKGEPFKVAVLSQEKLTSVLTNVYEDMASRHIAFHKKVFRAMHRKFFGVKPSDDLQNFYIQMLISEEAPLGEKYSMETAAKAMFKTLKIAYQIP